MLGIACVLVTAPLGAQGIRGGQSGHRALLPRDREITLARSAGPAAVTDSATIYILTDRGYEVAVTGASGAACYVSRDWVESLEPHCFDAEGAATILPLAMHRVALLHGGKSRVEADREIADGLASGRFRVPRRPAVSYMLSAAQSLIADDGRKVGAWQPHIMIYYPYLTAADIGLMVGDGAAGLFVVDPGQPTSNVVIVVKDFVQPRGEAAGR
jgi:hypothetical protein